MVSKHLCITNPDLLDYIQILIVSFPKNKVGLIFTLLFRFSVVSGFSRFHSKYVIFKGNIKKEHISFQIDR